MLNKKNLTLIIALCIPVLMIILVAGFIYLPGIGKKPTHNFLYVTGNGNYLYPYNQLYQVSGGHLIQIPKIEPTTPLPPSYVPPENVKAYFYVYDVAKGEAKEITFAEAQSYLLDSSNTSSDGYVIQRGNSSTGGDLFFSGGSSDYNTWFIKGYNRSMKLNLKLTGPDYYNFQFLGWVD